MSQQMKIGLSVTALAGVANLQKISQIAAIVTEAEAQIRQIEGVQGLTVEVTQSTFTPREKKGAAIGGTIGTASEIKEQVTRTSGSVGDDVPAKAAADWMQQAKADGKTKAA